MCVEQKFTLKSTFQGLVSKKLKFLVKKNMRMKWENNIQVFYSDLKSFDFIFLLCML
jgi:hypothetical protein